MKKYFLIVVLLTVVFLGLGSYTNGQSVAEWNTNDCLLSNPTITEANLTHVTPLGSGYCCVEEAGKDKGTGLPVCTAAQTIAGGSSVPCNIEGSALKGKDHAWVDKSGLMCVCENGYKKVNNVCKPCSDPGVCCGIQLNTSVPFVGKCIEDVKTNQGADETSVTGATAFPTLMGSLTKILVTLILITSFVLIIIGGIMIATGNPSGGRKMIINVVIGIALLGASGVILRLINPNFFG